LLVINLVEICCYLLKELSGYHIVIMDLFNKIKLILACIAEIAFARRILWVDTFPLCLLPHEWVLCAFKSRRLIYLQAKQFTHKLYMKSKCISYLQKMNIIKRLKSLFYFIFSILELFFLVLEKYDSAPTSQRQDARMTTST